MDLDRIVAELKRERERLSRAIAALEGTDSPAATSKGKAAASAPSERKETRPPHRGGQKAVVGSDEEALGGT